MTALRADRRLYETENKDEIREEGEIGGRWLLAGVGSTIGASDVEKYGLKMKGGRVRYKGGAKLPNVKAASKPEDKAASKPEDKAKAAADREAKAEEEREEHVLRFGGGDEVTETETEAAAEGGADDSDRNKDEVPTWAGRTSPEAYLKRYPDGPKAELANAAIAARDGADGGS